MVAAATLFGPATFASATEFHAGTAPHTLWSGTQVGEDVLSLKAGTLRCKKISSSGTTTVATATTVDLTPSFSECTAFGFVSTTVDANGCTYRLHTAKEGSSTQGTSILCPEGKAIVITAFNCEVSIPAQGVLGTVTYTNTEGDITADLNITGVKYTQVSKSFPGCTNGTFTDGTYKGTTTLTATDTAGTAKETWVEGVTGGTEFHAGTSPHTLWSGTQSGEDVFTVKAGTVKCRKITSSGTTTAATTTTLDLTPSFSECTAFGFVGTTVDANGCIYRLHTAKEGISTQGTSIVCPEGKAIVVTASNCELSVPAQGVLGTVTYTNTEGDITADLNLSAIKYTQVSKSFPGCTNGTFTDGKYVGATTLTATDTAGTAKETWVE